MKKTLLILLTLSLAVEPASAQFLKKLFKKKHKTEQQAAAVADGIDDAAQTAMLPIDSLPDNSNNRNAFMGIPIGIKAGLFEQQLLRLGYAEQQHAGPQTGKSYTYHADVWGAPSTVALAVSEQTGRVYAVDVTEETVYNRQTVARRFDQLKAEMQQCYGPGYVDNQGEAYTVQTPLGTVNVHYERNNMGDSYTIGITVDDAKAYRKAYDEMEERTYEPLPRTIEGGLAPACSHTDVAGLVSLLSQARTVARAQALLRQYDYVVGRATAKALTATFSLGSYRASVSLPRRKQAVTSVVLTATDQADAVRADLQTYGFTTTDQKTYVQGRQTIVLSADKQGRVVLSAR